MCNNVYDGHAQQKLVTPHIQDRYTQAEKKKKQWKNTNAKFVEKSITFLEE